jgi:hypothetical protein
LAPSFTLVKSVKVAHVHICVRMAACIHFFVIFIHRAKASRGVLMGRRTMANEPNIAELPPGPELGGGGGRPIPPHRGPIAELPPGPPWEAVSELFRLRDRVHALESQALAAKLYGGWQRNPGLAEIPQASEIWRRAELPPVESLYRSFTGGELSGPDYTRDQLIGLLEALLAALRGVVPPNTNPSEIPR